MWKRLDGKELESNQISDKDRIGNKTDTNSESKPPVAAQSVVKKLDVPNLLRRGPKRQDKKTKAPYPNRKKDADSFQLFVGNLSADVTDDKLKEVFSQYKSLVQAFVARDQKEKPRGFGFVGFTSPEDYFNAFREMNNKYIGSKPVQLKKAKR